MKKFDIFGVPTLEVNEDELIGFIMRNIFENDETRADVDYEDIKAVLDAELEFLSSKGIAGN